ncbi:MAG: imidazoleglycerol-phosphate dehydratase HisB [Spirochaetales bacterium]|nr:imidazoleglycerol-phosphate dehydratase HisB [Spirochaetales bacterium]MBR6061447.1 imidazoleglycerol-phosphate dehydratase HisB [Spirochaetales bacterium]MBR6200521.1 imidazoleglycerol-phosphate dehydratase HisB [Spirochaetales bacterium]
MSRTAELSRKTKETDIKVKINLDKSDESKIDTGIPFLDHMLNAFTKHGRIGLELTCKGDLEVDCHHTMEDVGIALGECFDKAIGDKKGINRFADAYTPLDESLTRCVIDISGRPYLHYDVSFTQPDDGNNVNPYLFEEFFRGFVMNAKITMHIDLIHGKNSHHILESVFKSFAVAMREAIAVTGSDIPSTKGVL